MVFNAHMTTRYKMIIAYDGTDFAGWQTQPGEATVQDEVERVLLRIIGQPVRIHHSGRTDSGVHAKGQVVHFDLEKPLRPRFQYSLNSLLDSAVRVMHVEEADADFHARFLATGKEYRYQIWNGSAVPPELRLYRFHERRALDLDAMRQAAAVLIGTHDFAAFTANANREITDTVKTVREIEITRTEEGDVCIRVEGKGFLYKMVRSIAGLLLRVGIGEVDASETARILNEKKRTNEVPTAEALGLSLWSVTY